MAFLETCLVYLVVLFQSIQIIIGVLCLCLSVTILQLYEEVHFSPDVIVVVVIVAQVS